MEVRTQACTAALHRSVLKSLFCHFVVITRVNDDMTCLSFVCLTRNDPRPPCQAHEG